jgi:hypothetical protein
MKNFLRQRTITTSKGNLTPLYIVRRESPLSACLGSTGPFFITRFCKLQKSSRKSSRLILTRILASLWASVCAYEAHVAVTYVASGWRQSTIGDGTRSSSATSYLAPEFIQRENLHVLVHAQVSQLVDPSNVAGKVVFGGVRFSQGTESMFLMLPISVDQMAQERLNSLRRPRKKSYFQRELSGLQIFLCTQASVTRPF